MENFTKYAEYKRQIAELESKCDALKVELMPLLKTVDLPMKYAGGRFTIVTRKSYKYSEALIETEADFKDKINVLKDHEVVTGQAVETISESLSFTADKENGKQETTN